jgi:hypothetical protein
MIHLTEGDSTGEEILIWARHNPEEELSLATDPQEITGNSLTEDQCIRHLQGLTLIGIA